MLAYRVLRLMTCCGDTTRVEPKFVAELNVDSYFQQKMTLRLGDLLFIGAACQNLRYIETSDKICVHFTLEHRSMNVAVALLQV